MQLDLNLSPGLKKVDDTEGCDSEAEDSVESLESPTVVKGRKSEFDYSSIPKRIDRSPSIEKLVLDIPLYRDKKNNLKAMETVFGSIMMGCAMG